MTFIFLLIGCDEIDALLGGVTDPDVAEGLVVALSAPPEMDLSGTEYASGGRAAAYITTIDGAMPTDLTLDLVSPTNGSLAFGNEGDGVWSTAEGTGVSYTPGETLIIKRDGAEILRALGAEAAAVEVPSTHLSGSALSIDLGDADYDGLIVTVLDLATKEQRWTNAPDSAGVVYDLLVAEPVLSVDVPGEVFATPGDYAVGVAGLRVNQAVDVTDVNSLASLMATGVLEFTQVTVPAMSR